MLTRIIENVNRMKQIHKIILEYIDNDNDEENFENLIKLIKNQKIHDDRNNFRLFLKLLLFLSKHHYRNQFFFNKIEKILLIFKKEIQSQFANLELFYFFKGSKRLLLSLIEEKLIVIDQTIYNIISKNKYLLSNYPQYFFPECKQFMFFIMAKCIEHDFPKNFEQKRKIGENENYIAELIKKDLIEEFITYVNKTNYSLNSEIGASIFETNNLLLKKKTTLIEYSAFYGSIQIFKYLYLNNVELTPDLWIYAVHSRNPEIFFVLESNKIKPIDTTYQQCLKESIKCHHNDVADYIFNNLIISNDNEFDFDNNIYSYSFQYHNYSFFPNDIKDSTFFLYSCKYNYINLVLDLLKTQKIDVNNTISIVLLLYFLWCFF